MRFDVAMCDFKLMNEVKTSEDLVAEDFNVHGRETFASCLFDEIVQIALVVGHGDVEELSALFEGGIGA